MRRTTLAAALAAGLLTLTGCSSSSDAPSPAPTVTTTVTQPPALSKAEQTQACIEAVADVITARPADFDPETDSDPKPAECDSVPDDEYLDAYMDGLQLSNERGRAALGG